MRAYKKCNIIIGYKCQDFYDKQSNIIDCEQGDEIECENLAFFINVPAFACEECYFKMKQEDEDLIQGFDRLKIVLN